MTHYEVLGLAPQADADAVKAAWRDAIKRWHPDRCADADAAQRFSAARQAHEILSDPIQRAIYDRSLAPRNVLASVELQLPLLAALRGGRLSLNVELGPHGVRPVVLDVPPGVFVGYRWRLPGQGVGQGDLLVTLRMILPDPRWRLVGDDIHGTLQVGLAPLLEGSEVVVDAPLGPVAVRLPPRSLAPLRVRGKGRAGGDLVLALELVWPASTPALLEELRRQTRVRPVADAWSA